jgi:hypothetical protein
MTRLKAALLLITHNLRELLIAIDQAGNVIVCTLTLQTGYSDETLSAHCWRAYRDDKPWGRILMPPIDWLFSWQKPDPKYRDEQGNVITGHCRRAYLKEQARDYMPPEYRKTEGASPERSA